MFLIYPRAENNTVTLYWNGCEPVMESTSTSAWTITSPAFASPVFNDESISDEGFEWASTQTAAPKG